MISICAVSDISRSSSCQNCLNRCVLDSYFESKTNVRESLVRIQFLFHSLYSIDLSTVHKSDLPVHYLLNDVTYVIYDARHLAQVLSMDTRDLKIKIVKQIVVIFAHIAAWLS